MTSDSVFVAFVNHAIQYVQVIHDYYNKCYNTKTEEYMIGLEQAAERSKNNMYNITQWNFSLYTATSVQSTNTVNTST